LVLPLRQHLGAPSTPIVRVGDRVIRGQKIAEANGFVSVPLHASATGTVAAIEKRPHPSGTPSDAVVIEVDHTSPQTLYDETPLAWQDSAVADLLDAVKGGGFVGLGGAAFPTHVKFSVPEGKRVEWFLINGAECEPYLTSDHRIMVQFADSIFLGIRVAMKILGAKKCFIGVERNKWDAIEKLRGGIPSDLPCEIVPLEVKYPQGAEKMLISAMIHREVPSGRLPIDVQVVVSNVGSIAGMGEMVAMGKPLIERIVTVTGPGVRNPATLLVPVGTLLGDVIDYCGGITDDTRQVLLGGPMMGNAQYKLDVPVLKGTSGVVCLTDAEVLSRRELACIRCSSCLDACPVFLNPSELGFLARAGRYHDMLNLHVMDCMECGSCSYVCPSNIPLVQRFRVAKALLREEESKAKAAAV
jgi:electron transport complex protein RnfC